MSATRPTLLAGRLARRLCCLVAALAMPLAYAGAGDEKVLNVYNWSDYISDETIHNFERETGIKVNYDTFDSNEAVHAKLRAGHSGYDIVSPSAHWARRQIAAGLLMKLDKRRITTWGNLDPWVLQRLAVSANDPGNDYVVPYVWGLTTVGINVDKVKSVLGTMPWPDDAWDLLFKPEYMNRLRSCGVSFLDTADDVFPAALQYIGKSPYSHVKSDYPMAGRMLAAVRPDITVFSSSSYINGLADGSLCAVLGWSGDIAIAAQRAREARNGQHIDVLVPKSGAFMFLDTHAIPADAPHVDNAYKWLSYIYRPDVQAAIVKAALHNSAVRASDKLLPPELRTLSGLFFTPEELARVRPQETLPEDVLRARTRSFTSFKAGL
jgi:putrescine transport system substrate-binding protein